MSAERFDPGKRETEDLNETAGAACAQRLMERP